MVKKKEIINAIIYDAGIIQSIIREPKSQKKKKVLLRLKKIFLKSIKII